MKTRWNAAKGRLETEARGRAVLADPRLNRGTAFTQEERRALDLVGLVPPQVLTQDQQVARAYAQYSAQPNDLAKGINLTGCTTATKCCSTGSSTTICWRCCRPPGL